MKKRIFKYCLFFISILFYTCLTIEADLYDYSGGGTGASGSMGSGQWLSEYVGVKISIVDSSNKLEDVEIFLNSTGKAGSYFSYENFPKTKQSYDITWVDSSKRKSYTNSSLPSNWRYGTSNNRHNIDLYDHLSSNNYTLLLKLIETPGAFVELSPGDYILVEPMVRIGNYYGTGFELGRAFFNLNSCGSGSFCYNYGKSVFGGNSNNTGGGLFFTTLYVDTAISDVNVYNMSNWLERFPESDTGTKYDKRNKCIKAKSCGRGIGVFKYDDIYSGKLKIVKKETGTNKVISGAGFTLYSDSSCSKKIKNEKTTNSNGEVVFTNLATSNYYYKETKAPSGYTGDNNCRLANVTNGNTTSITAYNNKKITQGNLTIYIKKYINGKKTNDLILSPTSQATYNIYKGTNCNGTIIKTVKTSSGYVPGFSLDVGTYSIGETITPNGYIIAPPGYSPEKNKCVKSSVSISANSNKDESIFYEPSCSTRLNESDKSVSSLIALYQEFGFNGLLDYKTPSCKKISCPDPDEQNPIVSCLAGLASPPTFNEDNMACFNESIQNDVGSYVGFCADTLTLKNKLGSNNFYSKSGQFLIRKAQSGNIQFYKNKNELFETDSPYVATADVGRICYVLNGNTPKSAELKRKNIKVYFGNNDPNDGIDADELQYDFNFKPTVSNTINGFVKYEYKDTYNFKLNTVYLERITGKVGNKKNGTISDIGIILQFKPAAEDEKYIPFELKYGGKKFTSEECKYKTDPEIIKYPPDNTNGEIDLEFRIINIEKPFLNEKGEIRQTNSNWCDYSVAESEQCNANNNVVIENIMNATNSYGRNSSGVQEPIYKIKLTPSDIKKIREYNKENTYDNYEVYCTTDPVEGEKCENAFIKSLKNETLKKYQNNVIKKEYGSISKLYVTDVE